jgi:hypothetical protein
LALRYLFSLLFSSLLFSPQRNNIVVLFL